MAGWDLTALLNAADPKAALPARNLWLARLLEWLRHPSRSAEERGAKAPLPVLRLKHLLNVLERNPQHAASFAGVWASIWRDMEATSLFADVGFASRMALWSEFLLRLRLKVLPGTVDTRELGELFGQLFPEEEDEPWLLAIDDELLERLAALFTGSAWREPMLNAVTVLVSAVQAAGLSGPLRPRMSPELLISQPFYQLPKAAEQFAEALRTLGQGERGNPGDELRRSLQYLRALLDSCRLAALSVPEHL
eukprot:Opistho-2@90873